MLKKYEVPRVVAVRIAGLTAHSPSDFGLLCPTQQSLEDLILEPINTNSLPMAQMGGVIIATQKLWNACRRMVKKNEDGDDETLEDPNIRVELLELFATKHKFSIPLQDQPSDKLLSKVLKHVEERTPKFIAMHQIKNAVDTAQGEGKKGQILGVPVRYFTDGDANEPVSDNTNGSLYYLHAMKILCYTYVLAGLKSKSNYVTMDGIFSHYYRIEEALRSDSTRGHKQHQIYLQEQELRKKWYSESLLHREHDLDTIIRNSATSMLGSWPHTAQQSGRDARKNKNLLSNKGGKNQNKGKGKGGRSGKGKNPRSVNVAFQDVPVPHPCPPGLKYATLVNLCQANAEGNCTRGNECTKAHSQAARDEARRITKVFQEKNRS